MKKIHSGEDCVVGPLSKLTAMVVSLVAKSMSKFSTDQEVLVLVTCFPVFYVFFMLLPAFFVGTLQLRKFHLQKRKHSFLDVQSEP